MEKIISFDIWDTIIKRKCHPEEIKLYTSKYIVLKYNEKLKKEYANNIYEILNKRDNIEATMCQENGKKGFDSECRIVEVFKNLQEEIFKDKIEDISAELLKAEVEQEKRVIFVNPEIIPIFKKYKKLKKYCISDFYMDADTLMELLNYLNIEKEYGVKIEKIFSSADYLLNKKSGKLYEKAEEELNIKPENHIHVGDNQYSDIENAQKLGIETIKTTTTHFDFEPHKERRFDFKLNSIKKNSDSREDKLYNVGVDLAPILYFFIYNISEYAIRNKIDTVHYCTREGETFIKPHQMMLENNPFGGIKIPNCELLEVSRMATFSASLNTFSIEELLRLWSQYRQQSMKALFKTLAIDIKQYDSYFKKYDIDIEEKIVDPWFNPSIHELFSDEEFISKINSELQRKRKELLEYFEKSKNIVNDDKTLFVVDIGWRGTIQDNLAYIFNNKKIDGYYLALFDFYNMQPKNTNKNSFIHDQDVIWNQIAPMLTLLEWIFTPDSGSVIEYKNGKAVRKAKKQESEAVKNSVKHIQEGMFEGSKVINDYLILHPYLACEFDNYINQLLKSIKENPSEELVEVYYNIVFNDTFGTGEYVEKKLKMSVLDKLNIIKCRNILRNETWKEAFIIHNNLKYMNVLLNIKANIRKIIKR